MVTHNQKGGWGAQRRAKKVWRVGGEGGRGLSRAAKKFRKFRTGRGASGKGPGLLYLLNYYSTVPVFNDTRGAPVVTVFQTDNRERVVQISRRERINGEDALRPEVAAPRYFRCRNRPGGVVRGQVGQHLLVKFREIHVVFQQQGFRSHCNVRAIPYTYKNCNYRLG
jgi:hypothetical protein